MQIVREGSVVVIVVDCEHGRRAADFAEWAENRLLDCYDDPFEEDVDDE
jgi:hypothetical protein